ncbi:major facilitator superfamily domain-containing protein [Xylariales sp. AK1849]|nr:major facilitator superfamily domain-containing protein [Xylariales sp. AK1849]
MPNAGTPITDLYLTFDTVLPAVNSSSLTDDELPPYPDLSRYGNPTKMPVTQKNIMLFLSCIATLLTAYTAGAYSPPADLLAAEFNVSRTGVLTGITMFTVGFGIAPMVLAPFSEINGRYPVFVVSGIVFVIFQTVCGLVTNLGGMLVARFFCGVGGSVFSTMIGGVIADLWDKEERNTPMALYSGAVLIGTGLGPLDASLMVYKWGGDGIVGPGAKWRWVFWHQVILDTVMVLALAILFSESRGSVLLSRKARSLNKWYMTLEDKGVFGVWIRDTSDGVEDTDTSLSPEPSVLGEEEKAVAYPPSSNARAMETRGFKLQRIRWSVKEDEQRASLATMISVSLFRPFHLLFTEPAVFFFSLWVSFAWAVLYLTFGSIPLVFRRQYGFNMEQTGYVFIAMIVGSILATTIGVYQEGLLKHPKWQRKAAAKDSSKFWSFMRRRFPVEAPESRLYFTCITSILLPAGLFLFGFSAEPDIHWIVPTIAITMATMGIYYVYLATFNYLADSYQSYASSALAAQSFCRNMLGGAFPLVVGPLFINLGEDAAGALLGAVATLLTVVPWVLAFFGANIRKRSIFAVALEDG